MLKKVLIQVLFKALVERRGHGQPRDRPREANVLERAHLRQTHGLGRGQIDFDDLVSVEADGKVAVGVQVHGLVGVLDAARLADKADETPGRQVVCVFFFFPSLVLRTAARNCKTHR